MASTLPSGTLTFLFTDIESSTKLWEQFPKAMKSTLARHDDILRQAVESNHGRIIKTTGDGIHAVFDTTIDGIAASIAAQKVLSGETWDQIKPQSVRVRMGVHTGEVEQRAGDYYGTVLNRAARLMSTGHGGQILMTNTTADLVRDHLSEGVTLRDLGEHRLKDLVRPERVFQLSVPGLPGDFPPLNSLDAYPNNLPVQLTSFVGREHEMDEARRRLESARLLTLIGPGGTGKTRLALQLAADLLPTFGDGVWLVELAPLADPSLILQTIASVFSLREQLGMSLIDLVLNYLRAKNLLLILDNCEHLIDACASFADQLLHASPGLKILASSREALGITGESVYRVPSLSLPKQDQVTRESLTQSESVQLFLVRATAANPKFNLNDRNMTSIAQICRRLDGIPLALELAAARVTVFSPEQIASKLDDRFRLLTGGSRTALPRQQTLRALIDWSYDMLPEPERALIRRLSVFAGGWSFEAAESIGLNLDVLTSLTQLVNKSLVTAEDEGGETRYRLLETVRQYARDKLLEAGESEQARNSHFEFFLKLIKTAEPKLQGSEALDWIAKLDLEYDNIRAAMEWGLEENVEFALRMACALLYYWNRRGHDEEGRRWILEALEKSKRLPKHKGEEDQPTKKILAEAWHTLGILGYGLGDNGQAIVASREAETLARELGDNRLLAVSLAFDVSGSLFLGETTDLDPILEECLTAARASGDQYSLGLSLSMAGQVILMKKGNADLAHDYFEEGAFLMKASGNAWGFTMAILGIGMMEKYLGDFGEARSRFLSCEPIFRELGDKHRMNMIKSELAHIERYEGHYDQARSMYRETILEWERIGHRAAIAHQLECFACIAIVHEEDQRAGVLFGAAEALREKINIPMTSFERVDYEGKIAELRARMDDQAFTSAWMNGRATTMEQAIRYALN
jgi:predicted ATPase/class 3 adenylate cyclase